MPKLLNHPTLLAVILLATLQPAGVSAMNEQQKPNCTVHIAAPTELKEYLVAGANPKTCSLSQKFAPENLEAFISKLAKLPSDTDGETAKLMLVLLYNWALSADTKQKQEQLCDKIGSCLKKITDPDAHEELTYWFDKCSDILPETSSMFRAIALDRVYGLKIPRELEDYSFYKENANWVIEADLSVERASKLINTLIAIPPEEYSAQEHITFKEKALLSLCKWAIRLEKLENCQERLTAIKKHIDQTVNPVTRQELTYWFKKGLSSCLFVTNTDSRTTELLTLLLNNGAYLKSTYHGKTLFNSPFLDETLYKKLEKTGLKPNEKALKSAIVHMHDTALDTLLRHGINIHKQSKDGSNVFVKIAIDSGNHYALRRLIQTGIDINRKNKDEKTLLEYEGVVDIFMHSVLLGQQPKSLPSLETHNINAYDADAYNDFIEIKNDKDLKKWFYDHVNYKNKQISNAFIDFGTTQQFRYGVPRYLKNRKRFKKLNHINTLHVQKQPGVIYAKLCINALKRGADMGFFRLLSLAVQQQIIQRWMFEKERQEVPKNIFLLNREAQSKTFNALKKTTWPIGEYEMRLVDLAFIPLVIQDTLKKTINVGKGNPKLGDIKIRFRKS